MEFKIFHDRNTLGRAAAAQAAAAIPKSICERGKARIVAATAASQKEFLEALTSAPEIQWLNVEGRFLYSERAWGKHKGAARRLWSH
jgi:glucosamine-6-phosphate deaminase